MATYIKGVTDIIPDQAAAKVDWKVISTGLTALQGRYDKGYDQIKSMYNSLINSELSSSDNVEFRKEYLKKADAFLSQLAGVDLANANNVNQAMQIFDPLVNDKQYTRDIYLSKAQKAEFGKLQNVKMSTDPKVHALYNPAVEEYLMYGQERLNAMKRDDGSIEAATFHQFTPWQDPIEYASTLAKEQGLEYKFTEKNGLYLVKTVNGKKSEIPFNNWFRSTIGNRFDNQFKIEAYNDNERAVRGLMAQDPTLNRDAALNKLSSDYSTQYIKSYDNQVGEMQASVDAIDREIRLIKRKNPNGVDAKTLNYLNELTEKKNESSQLLSDLKSSRGTDDELRNKAINMYKNNPSGILLNEVRDRYAKRFAYKQAYGKVEYDIEADPVALQLQQQSFNWAKMLAEQKFDRDWGLEKMAKQQEYDIQLAQLKKEIPGVDIGAQVGSPTDVGAMSLDKVYTQIVADEFNNGVKPFTRADVLAIAAGYAIVDGVPKFPPGQFDIVKVSQGIQKTAMGQAITPAEKQELISYLNKVGVGKIYKVSDNITFPEIQAVINRGVNQHKNANPDYAASVTQLLDGATASRKNWSSMYAEKNMHLYKLLQQDPSLKEYVTIKRLPNGTAEYDINYTAVNGLDVEDKAEMLDKLIPSSKDIRARSSAQMPQIVLNPSKPDTFDYNVLRSVIDNASNIGVTVDGEFNQYDEDAVAKFREITKGSANMKEVFDPNGTTYERKVLNGADFIKVTMPVKRKVGDGKSSSVAASMGFDLSDDIEKTNKIEFYVPLSKAERIAGNDVTYRDPVTNQIKTLPNDLRRLIMNMAGRSLVGEPKSWISTGLAKSNVVALPSIDYGYKIEGGAVYRTGADNNELALKFTTNEGDDYIVSLTDKLNITYSMLQQDPSSYDYQLKNFIDDLVSRYDAANTTAAKQQRAQQKLNTNLIPWNKTPYANY